MFQRFSTSELVVPKTHNFQQRINRRSLLSGLGGLGAMASLGACAETTNSSGPSLNLDFSQAEDNLTAWVKLVSSLEDVETCGFFGGIHYADIGPQETIQPLFRIQGFGMSRVTRLPDGRYENLHREIVFYLDLKEDRILEEWENPFTGETVEVFHTHNDPVNSYYSTSFKQRFGDPETGIETIEFPFILPWDIFDDRAVVSFAVNTRWPSPLPPPKWPREHFGEYYRTSEYFQIHSSLANLNNPDILKVPYTGSWQKIAPWHPWMAMAGIPGGIIGISSVFSLDSVEQLPPHILAYTEENYPKYLHAPTVWEEPNMATWETYAKERTPLPAR
ncbi:MAG: DUF1838 family protein [Pseudomonadota bacterium]|nr:DUF1838 family protein [Pseudomonadota bacterium]